MNSPQVAEVLPYVLLNCMEFSSCCLLSFMFKSGLKALPLRDYEGLKGQLVDCILFCPKHAPGANFAREKSFMG